MTPAHLKWPTPSQQQDSYITTNHGLHLYEVAFRTLKACIFPLYTTHHLCNLLIKSFCSKLQFNVTFQSQTTVCFLPSTLGLGILDCTEQTELQVTVCKKGTFPVQQRVKGGRKEHVRLEIPLAYSHDKPVCYLQPHNNIDPQKYTKMGTVSRISLMVAWGSGGSLPTLKVWECASESTLFFKKRKKRNPSRINPYLAWLPTKVQSFSPTPMDFNRTE